MASEEVEQEEVEIEIASEEVDVNEEQREIVESITNMMIEDKL